MGFSRLSRKNGVEPANSTPAHDRNTRNWKLSGVDAIQRGKNVTHTMMQINVNRKWYFLPSLSCNIYDVSLTDTGAFPWFSINTPTLYRTNSISPTSTIMCIASIVKKYMCIILPYKYLDHRTKGFNPRSR